MDRATAPSPAAPRRRGEAARALLVAGACAASACALNQQGVTPPVDTFFYPASAIVDPTASWLFVTNSNADLRYNDGTLVMVDLNQAKRDRTQRSGLVPAVGGAQETWELCPQEDYVSPLYRSDPQICCWDRLDHGILNCDERRYVQASSTVAIGSFAAGMVWQPYCSGRCDMKDMICSPDAKRGRLLIGVRGDTSLTEVDVDLSKASPFDCGQPAGGSPAECSAASRIIDTKSALVTEATDKAAPPVPLPDEPYALALDSRLSLLYVGHLVGSTATVNTGGVSLFDVSSSAPLTNDNFISPFGSPFPPNSAGAYGITALKLHVPLGQSAVVGASQEIFASSRYVPLVTAMVPFGMLSQCPGDVTDEGVQPAGDTFNSEQLGSEMRGIEFIDPPAPDASTPPPPAQRAYALQRVPPYLVGFGISANEAGGTSATPTDLLETCSSPTFLYQHDAGAGTRLYVSCFDTGEVYVFDPTGPTLETIFQAGRGPAGIVFPDADPTIAYLIGFSDNNVSVLDLAPGSATQYHVIQRLGFPSVTPR